MRSCTHVLSFLALFTLFWTFVPLSHAFLVVFAPLLAVFCALARLPFAKPAAISPIFRHFILSPVKGVWLASAMFLASI